MLHRRLLAVQRVRVLLLHHPVQRTQVVRLPVQTTLQRLLLLLVQQPQVLHVVLVLSLDLLDLYHMCEPLFLDLHLHLIDPGVHDHLSDLLGLLPLALHLGDPCLHLLALDLPREHLLALVNQHLLDVQLHLLHRLLPLVLNTHQLVVTR